MADEVEKPGAPNSVAARLDRADGLSFVIATLVTLAVYLFTLAPEVTVTWSGVMSASATYGGVAPPPGYPAWTIYSWLFINLIPFSNIACRVAAGSAVAGAVACGLVALMVSRSGNFVFHENPALKRFDSREQNSIRVVCGCVAGLGLGLSGRFWYEAVIPEYWTFTVLLFVLMVSLLMRWVETGRRRWCWLAFLVYGLLLTGNQELIIALPGIVCMVIVVDPKLGRDVAIVTLPLGAAVDSMSGFPTMAGFGWNRPILEAFAIAFVFALLMVPVTRGIGSEWKSALACGLFLLLGLALYFYLPIVSMANPPVNWAYPRTAEGFLHVVSRGQYELVNPTFGFARFTMQPWGALKHAGREFGWLYVAFAALPFGFLGRMSEVGRKWLLSLLPLSVCVGPLLLALSNPNGVDRQTEEFFEPYFFASRAVLALWAGIGLTLFAMMVSQPKGHAESARASITG
jgi:hypothetical protein